MTKQEFFALHGITEASFHPKDPTVDTNEPTQADRIEAQVLYTALMTDTLLEDDDVRED